MDGEGLVDPVGGTGDHSEEDEPSTLERDLRSVSPQLEMYQEQPRLEFLDQSGATSSSPGGSPPHGEALQVPEERREVTLASLSPPQSPGRYDQLSIN